MPIPAMVPRYDTRGLVSALFLGGCLWGVASAMLPANGWNWGTQLGSGMASLFVDIAVLAALVLGPPVLLGVPLALVCRRRLVVFAAGVAASAGQSGTSMILVFGAHLGESLGTPEMLLALATMIALYAPIFGLLVFAAHQLTRLLIFRVFEGTPTTCRKCSYDAATDRAPVCPECGTPVVPGKFRFRVLHALLARVRPHARTLRVVSVLVLAALVCGAVLIGELSPARAFFQRFRPLGQISTSSICRKVAAVDVQPISCPGVILRPTAGSPTVLWVSYLPREKPGYPAMQLQLHTDTGTAILGLSHGYSSEMIFSNLDRTQSDWIIAHGIPKGLIDAMLTAQTNTSYLTGRPVYIDPSPYIANPAAP